MSPQRRSTDGPESKRSRRKVTAAAVLASIAVALAFAAAFLALSLNSRRTIQIQDERSQNIRRNCEDVNARHDRTIVELDRILEARQRRAGPAERDRLRESRATTVLLIEALVPRRSCDALVREQVNSG